MKYRRILQAISDTPWAILPAKMDQIVGVIEARSMGITLTAAEMEHFAAKKKKYTGVKGGVAVIPVYGTISQRLGLMTASGGTSIDEFAANFDQALADPAVGAIVADFDTPGGSVAGVQEMAQRIFDARGNKPMVAVANAQAASAGIWLATAFDELVVTPSGDVGSIGVYSVHVDYSAQNEEEGVKVTYISAGDFKVEGNPDAPLSKEARDYEQARINEFYAAFVDAVAKNRDVSSAYVKKNFGQGRTMGAAAAVEVGLADRVAPLSQVVAELNAARSGQGRGTRATRVPGAEGRGAGTQASPAKIALLRKKQELRKQSAC